MDHTPSQRPANRELENHLINRALRDDQFRELLIANPLRALEVEIQRLQLGIALPPDLKIKVLEERPDTLYLILPPNLVGEAPAEEDFFLQALQAMDMGKSSNEPKQSSV